MKKVLVATPCYDGKVDVWYATSIINTVRLAQDSGVFVHPVFMSYDALIQRARNDLFRLAVEGDYDDMIFIDSDMEWDPRWILELLGRAEDVVGGTCRKKTDEQEIYVVKTRNLTKENGLIKVEALGTGFVKISKKAFMALWETSPRYQNEGRESRMVCDVQIIDGQLHSEDTVMFSKLRGMNFDIWLAPHMTCNHIGTKKFQGNFENYLSRLLTKEN